MDQRQFSRAEGSLRICAQKADALEKAIFAADAWHLWSEFLIEHQRWFIRMRHALARGPSSAWHGKLLKVRRDDPMLQYMEHARHADEHGLEDIATITGGIQIKGNGSKIPIKVQGRITSDRIWMRATQGNKPAIVTSKPEDLEVKPVINRNIKYPVPLEHLQSPIGSKHPRVFARLSQDFMSARMYEVRENFGLY
ncbi:hypothetical protein VVT58_04560 [Sphingobium sp. SJ10-10]|uniref:hypothetical protein n=1 Tax=Sphingobium sp. SJ10-10 TaxID=3114999 RepID=UPI002E191A74|nr:hypothetical protein [Sphingobium sp. SJ10-10]